MSTTTWFVEPYGREKGHTNEVIARELTDDNAVRRSTTLGVKKIWRVPDHAFVTALSGMDGVKFRIFTQEGNGQIRLHSPKTFRKKRAKKSARKKV